MRYALLVLLACPQLLRAAPTLLPQKPAVSAEHVVFSYADDLWVIPRTGGRATRLTAGPGLETNPVFSPDGTRVAFAGQYEGNFDVYVVPVAGGIPQRVTHHPGPDIPVGWTPDGKNVLFRSARHNFSPRSLRLFSVPATGGQPEELPLPMAVEGSLSPDGKRLAYVPYANTVPSPGGYVSIKRYRGGTASPVWIADLADSAVEKLPRTDSTDFNPMWVGDRVYFLSDRDGPTALFAYEPKTKAVRRLTDATGPDIKSASACADAIAYETFGQLYLFDLKTEKSKPIEIALAADIPGVRPRLEKAGGEIRNAGLSPTGVRAVFEARGEILTVPVEKGDVRNLTNTVGAVERDPAWSPDGKSVAYFSDASGEYELHVAPQDGRGAVKKYKLGDGPTFYYSPSWSPDGKRIAYTDKRLRYWYIDLDTGKSTKLGADHFEAGPPAAPVWSPDGKWLAYARVMSNWQRVVFLHAVETGREVAVTDGLSDAWSPAFDRSGKHLYFLTSTDVGPTLGSGMSVIHRGVTSSPYVVVLSKDDPSPLKPETGDEPDKTDGDKKGGKDEKKDGDKKDAPATRIDAADIDQRILALPMPAKNYVALLPGKAGQVLLLEGPSVFMTDPGLADNALPPATIHRFDTDKRKAEKLVEGATDVCVSHTGEKMLFRTGRAWTVAGTGAPVKPGEGALNVGALEVRIDPRAEWKQMFDEVRRIERDFLYDPNYHGLDIAAAWKKYAEALPAVGSRHDLNYLFDEMLGELCLQHVFVGGGALPKADGPRCGLLGADFKAENGRYRFARVYRGENWNPALKAPLTQPGAAVKEGEYLLAVNGTEVRAGDEVYRALDGTAGKQTVLTVGPNADGTGGRPVTVVPVGSETALRNLAWIDGNRRLVDQRTNGRVAYVYLPDTFVEGYTRFNRYLFPQSDRDAVIVDERFNSGGYLADHVVDYLRRPVRNYATSRDGATETFPLGAIPGPKVMLINEQAGSGGDYLPFTFRQAGLGPLVGKRTWGGLVGIGGYPTLMDGGTVTAPRWGIWFPDGKGGSGWEVENRGVAPDVEVELDPKLVRQGKDPQLDKAIEYVLAELKRNPVKHPPRPPFPNYYPAAPKAPIEKR
jgi:tricorn protease